ncbi:MAG TPA: prolipoprotein diacylglyceryl transferase family protein, partial [Gammaproteobacteria bacterium]|nr:prolipoprotein diacylglyceryl transferase family protein [Gammaproteobacteria bacterium]
MLQYPKFDPAIVHITDTLQVRWYGVMYIVAFVGCWLLFRLRVRRDPAWQEGDRKIDILFYIALGVILGGRIGYVLFYGLGVFLQDPLFLFRV